LRATPPSPRDLWPDIPRTLESLVLAMLAKEPDARPTMLTVAHTLELQREDLRRQREAAGEPIAMPEVARAMRWSSAPGFTPTVPTTWRSAKRRWQIAAGAFALAASALMFVVSRDHDNVAATPVHRTPISATHVPQKPDVAPPAAIAASAPAT